MVGGRDVCERGGGAEGWWCARTGGARWWSFGGELAGSSERAQLRRRASGGEGERKSGRAANSGHGVSDNAHAAATATTAASTS